MTSLIIKQSLLHQAANSEGFESIDEMIEAAMFDSVCPGICECGYITSVEPDGEGWCEECEKPTCTSVLLLAGVI